MGWFDEQIKQRKILDDEDFSEALYKISDSVTGKSIAKTLKADKEKTIGAISDIIAFYNCKPREASGEFDDINDEIEYMCRPHGIMHRVVKLEQKWYKDAFCVYLATDSRDGSLCSLLPDRISGKFRYFDTEKQSYVKVGKKESEYFEGDAICFYKPLPLRALKAKDLFKYGMSVWSVKDIVLPSLLAVFVTLLGLLVPRLNHFLFSEVIESQNINFLASTVLFLFCLSITTLLTNTVRTLITAKNQIKTDVSTEAAVMMRILSLPTSFFKELSSGEVMQRINYANGICGIFIELFFESGIYSLLSLAYFSQMARYGKALLLPAIIIIIADLLFSVAVLFAVAKNTKNLMQAQSKENGVAYSLITGVQKIKLAGAEKRAFSKWGNSYAEMSGYAYRPPFIVKFRDVITLAISLAGMVMIYFFSIKNNVSVADYYAFDTAYAIVSGAFGGIVGLCEMISDIAPTLDMIKPILDAEPEVSEGKTLISRLSGNIELNNITFAYEDSDTPVINNLSLKIRSGQYVAIVGKTGCGKSTLIRILLGFEKPSRGAVYYDGKDLQTIDLKSLRSRIGTVMQNGKLFQGDLFSNITVSAPHLTLDDAWEAAEMAGMSEDINRMPMGMQTLISEGGGGISGGQRQRIMIARAIAPKPSILIFDEATSALDNITQKTVSDSLDSLNCTRIVIAHRLSTIRHCDRIIYLDAGKIAEDGTYDELIAKNGLFAELVERQRLDSND